MLVFRWITGVAVGLEYFDDEAIGFGVNLDLGIIRVTWYRGLEAEE